MQHYGSQILKSPGERSRLFCFNIDDSKPMSRRRSRSPRRQSGPEPGVNLKLLHITKNAGTALEKLGKDLGLKWGKCWTEIKDHRGKLREPNAGCMKSEWWHVPPCFFVDDPYKNYICFAVVRCPYQRAISEFRCRWKGFEAPAKDDFKKDRRKNATSEDLNNWLKHKLKVPTATPYRNGHLIPQHLYIFDGNQRYVAKDRVGQRMTKVQRRSCLSCLKDGVQRPKRMIQRKFH